MDDLQDVGRRRPRWELGAIALLVVALVGAVVWERASGTAAHHAVAVAAVPDPNPIIAAVSVSIDGGSPFFVRNVQGLTITAKGPGTGLQFARGLTTDNTFTDWMKESGKAARHDLTLTLLDATFTPVRTFRVLGAVPVSLAIAPIDGTNQTLETLRLNYAGIEAA